MPLNVAMVPRVTSQIREAHQTLEAAGGRRLSPSQLQRAFEQRLIGDLSEVEALLALDALAAGPSGRRPDDDAVAMALAVAGVSCPRLPEAVARFRKRTPDPANDPESNAEHYMAESQASSPGGIISYGSRLARRFLEGSMRSEPVRAQPEAPTGKDRKVIREQDALERLGRAQAVITQFGEIIEGSPAAETIDSDDVAAVVGHGITPEAVRVTSQWFDLAFGPGWSRADELVENADSATLTASVRAADALRPLFEQLIFPVGTKRWEVVGGLLPVVIGLVDLVRQQGDVRTAAELLLAFADEMTAIPSLSADTEKGLTL